MIAVISSFEIAGNSGGRLYRVIVSYNSRCFTLIRLEIFMGVSDGGMLQIAGLDEWKRPGFGVGKAYFDTITD
jgi:hypothetical protein